MMMMMMGLLLKKL